MLGLHVKLRLRKYSLQIRLSYGSISFTVRQIRLSY